MTIDQVVYDHYWLIQYLLIMHYQTLAATHMDDKELTESIQKLLIVMQRLDNKIAPMLEADGEHFNKRSVSRQKKGIG